MFVSAGILSTSVVAVFVLPCFSLIGNSWLYVPEGKDVGGQIWYYL